MVDDWRKARHLFSLSSPYIQFQNSNSKLQTQMKIGIDGQCSIVSSWRWRWSILHLHVYLKKKEKEASYKIVAKF